MGLIVLYTSCDLKRVRRVGTLCNNPIGGLKGAPCSFRLGRGCIEPLTVPGIWSVRRVADAHYDTKDPKFCPLALGLPHTGHAKALFPRWRTARPSLSVGRRARPSGSAALPSARYRPMALPAWRSLGATGRWSIFSLTWHFPWCFSDLSRA